MIAAVRNGKIGTMTTIEKPPGYDGTYYPEGLEDTPRPFAIVKATSKVYNPEVDIATSFCQEVSCVAIIRPMYPG